MDFYADAMDSMVPPMGSMPPMPPMGGMDPMGAGVMDRLRGARMGFSRGATGLGYRAPSSYGPPPSAYGGSGGYPGSSRYPGGGRSTFQADLVSDVWDSAKTYSKSTGAIAGLLVTAIVWNMNLDMLQDDETGEPSIIKHAIFMVLVGVAANYFLKKQA